MSNIQAARNAQAIKAAQAGAQRAAQRAAQQRSNMIAAARN